MSGSRRAGDDRAYTLCTARAACALKVVGVLLTTGLLLVGPLSGRGFGKARSADTWKEEAWRSAIYYRASFSMDGAMEGLLHIAAVDSYEVYVNGDLVGSDSVWTRMRTYPVSLKTRNNDLAVKVVHFGRGRGNGLMAVLVGEDPIVTQVVVADNIVSDTTLFRYATTTDRSEAVWYWNVQGDKGWPTGTPKPEDGWRLIQGGEVDVDQVVLDEEQQEQVSASSAEWIAGFPGGVDLGAAEGEVRLKRVTGLNLAQGQPAQIPQLVDGDLSSSTRVDNSWKPGVLSLGYGAWVDLGRRLKINEMRVITKGSGAADFLKNSLRGYSVQISDNLIEWSEIGNVPTIKNYRKSSLTFGPLRTRYVRMQITKLSGMDSPDVVEMEVFGEGYALEGMYTSDILDFGVPDSAKNFDRIRWRAKIPRHTEARMQFRTGDTLGDFEDPEEGWGEEYTGLDTLNTVSLHSPEPAKFLQYRVLLATANEAVTPVFRGIEIGYSTEDIPVSRARGKVVPRRANMGVDSVFTYVLHLGFGAKDTGIEKIHIEVPSSAELVGDVRGAEGVQVERVQSTNRELQITFAEPIKDVDSLEVSFRTRLYGNTHRFRSYVYGPGSENPLNVSEYTQGGASWTVVVDQVLSEALLEVRAVPHVFSPNGDGVCDYTVIEFVLTKVQEPRAVDIQIFDPSGVMVRDLPVGRLTAGAYLHPRSVGLETQAPGYWDGKDENGDRVPPGIYLYRVKADMDQGEAIQGGTVVVAY